MTYRKALRKLLDANPELEANGKTGRTASADGTPAGKKTAAGGKRKSASASASATTTPVKRTEAPAETGGGDETAATVAGAVADFVAAANEEASLETPSKRARKTSTKKGIAQKVNKKDQAYVPCLTSPHPPIQLINPTVPTRMTRTRRPPPSRRAKPRPRSHLPNRP